jgi:hypothetical protein
MGRVLKFPDPPSVLRIGGVVAIEDMAKEVFLKQQMMLIEHFHVLLPDKLPPDLPRGDFDWLASQGIAEPIPGGDLGEALGRYVLSMFNSQTIARSAPFSDFRVRILADLYNSRGIEAVPLCSEALPTSLSGSRSAQTSGFEPVVKVAIKTLPIPRSALKDIIDFRNEIKYKDWNFRCFLKTLATKSQTEADIRLAIETMVYEYTNELHVHKLKAGESALETYIIPIIEAAENIAILNFSTFFKYGVSISKRQIELLEFEMKARGRECAYVFDAREKFGPRLVKTLLNPPRKVSFKHKYVPLAAVRCGRRERRIKRVARQNGRGGQIFGPDDALLGHRSDGPGSIRG